MKRTTTYKMTEDLNLGHQGIICPEKVIKVEPRMIREDFREIKHPDPIKHQQISFIKSAVRILGYLFLFWDIEVAALTLIASEVIGIWEELV